MTLRLGFLSSHAGSNMQAIIDACKQGRLEARPCVVISNNSGSMALQRAREQAIPAYHLSAKTIPDPGQLDLAILQALKAHAVTLVVLAGYMKKLGPRVLHQYRGRILNIHPALLPKFGGSGMYGKHVHEAVLRSGDKTTGVTIHVVDEQYDHGPILAQCHVPVMDDDTPDSLAERVLNREHEFYVDTLVKIAQGTLRLPT